MVSSSPTIDPAVSCRSLTKSYGSGQTQVRALRGVDLDVQRGELLMLVGPSGSGKTTLISIIAGLLDADGGRCKVLDRDATEMDPAERARFRGRSIGFIFQGFNLLPALTAVENISVPLLLNGERRRTALGRSEDLLERVGLAGKTGCLPSELSGGEQQRVAIARALVHDPELVICDEPTSNLDHAAGERVLEILLELSRRPDRAVVVVTHDPRILSFADRLARMDDGRIIESDAAPGVIS